MMSWLLEHSESGLFFSIAIALLIICAIRQQDFFKPARLYVLVQMVMLGISYFKVSPAMTDFRLNTWLVWGGGMLSFVVGCALVDLRWKKTGACELPSVLSLQAEYNWRRHFFLCFVAFAYFFIGVIGVVSMAGNLILFTKNPSFWLSGKDSPVLVYAQFFTSAAMVVGLFAVASFKSMNPIRWIRNSSRLMVVFTLLLGFMTFPSRGINMLGIGMVILLYNYLHSRFSWKIIVVLVAFIVPFFVSVAFLKGQYGDMKVLDNKKVKVIMMLPYKYIANNYWNLDFVMNRPSDIPDHSFTYGIDAWFGITQLLRIGDGLQQSMGWDSPFNESAVKVKGLNTIPYLWDAYKDFGYPGIFILPFFFGVLFTHLYHSMARAKNPMIFLFMCSFLMWIILWNFTTGYKQPMYWIWFLFFFLVCKACCSGQTKPFPEIPKEANAQSDISG